MDREPASTREPVAQFAVLHRSVIAFADVPQNDLSGIFGRHREPDGIGPAGRGQLSAPAGVAEVAEIPQFGIARLHGRSAGHALAMKPRAQRKPLRKRPEEFGALLFREKIRTGHSKPILVPMAPGCVRFFSMTEMSRLEMLTQFVEQNPNDAFARYGLAMEYSNQGQVDTALQQFHKLLELHPDYTNGYFMAAQALAKVERFDEAKALLQKGIESARNTGNQHALSEMTAMLDELG